MYPDDNRLNQLLLLYQGEQFIEAERMALDLTSKYPEHPFSGKCLVPRLSNWAGPQKSLVCMRRSVQLAPRDALAHSNLGATLRRLGNLEEAANCLQGKAIALNPDYAMLQYNLGAILQEKGQYSEAALLYQQSNKLDPHHVESLNLTRSGPSKIRQTAGSGILLYRPLHFKPDHAKAQQPW